MGWRPEAKLVTLPPSTHRPTSERKTPHRHRNRTEDSPPGGSALPPRHRGATSTTPARRERAVRDVRALRRGARHDHRRSTPTEARALPGVQVFTAAELGLQPSPPPPMIQVHESMFRSAVATDRVRYVGEIVAAVVAESARGFRRRCRARRRRLRPASRGHRHPRGRSRTRCSCSSRPAPTRACGSPRQDRIENLFDDCDVVISGLQREPPAARAADRAPLDRSPSSQDGKLTIYLSTQTPHQDKAVHRRHARAGARAGPRHRSRRRRRLRRQGVRRRGRPDGLRWPGRPAGPAAGPRPGPSTWWRCTTAARSGPTSSSEAAGTAEFKALRVKLLQDAGAYPGIGAFLAVLTQMMSSGVYDIPKIEVDVTAVVSNTTPIGPVRGAGRPEATQMIERAMDMFAAEAGLDPAEMRRRNFIANDAVPGDRPPPAPPTTSATTPARWTGRWSRPATTSCALSRSGGAPTARTCLLGIGLSVYVEITNGIGEGEFGAVEITEDGGAIVRTGSFSHGQGHETTFAQIVVRAHRHRRWRRSRCSRATPTGCPAAPGPMAPSRPRSAAPPPDRRRRSSCDRAKELAADALEASPGTWCSTWRRAASTSPARPSRRWPGRSSRGRLAAGRPAGRARRRDGLQARHADVPVRSPRRGRRGRRRDRRRCG